MQSSSGVLFVDKPVGITSTGLLNRLKKTHDLKKVGHAGTLDPDATGLLVVLVGKATKLQSDYMGCDKRYSGLMKLGLETSTDDISGEVLEEVTVPLFSSEELFTAAEKFMGEIEQLPPKVSALKVNGKRAYELARKGEDFELKPRSVLVSSLSVAIDDDTHLSYDVIGSKGFYVRSLARDLGRELGTRGCVSTIRRVSVGEHRVDSAVKLEDLLNATDISEHFVK